jgi:SAM-dependent methyltransferase
VDLDQLSIDSDNRIHGHRYEPTPYGVVEDMLAELGLDAPSYDFVDLGSGKGRVLCIAAQMPFHRVIGIEFAQELHAIAEENIGKLDTRLRRSREVRSILKDAADFEFPLRPTVVFLFNPFEPTVLAKVLANLERSFAAKPSHKVVLYYMPVHDTVFTRSEILIPRSASFDWHIYETRTGS